MKRTRSWLITSVLTLTLFALPVLALGATYLIVFGVFRLGDVKTPTFPAAQPVPGGTHDESLSQGWTLAEAREFHHKGQGTVILPAAWFRALEQPLFTPLPVGLFSNRSYLERFGFNYDEPPAGTLVPERASRELPIGFALEPIKADYGPPGLAFTETTQMVGLTCAACHTGRMDYVRDGQRRSVLIEGGGSMIDLRLFQEAVQRAVFMTNKIPERLRRFVDRIKNDPDGAGMTEAAIRQRLADMISAGTSQLTFEQEHKLIPVTAGFGRTDALDLIGNRVFGITDEQNQVVVDAPVNFPHLWDTSWFDWVQYNASIRTPMARNIGEALGVMALIKINRPDQQNPLGTVQTSVNVPNLAWMETLLGGTQPLADSDHRGEGLQPPRWNDVMGRLVGNIPASTSPLPEAIAINPALAAEGRVLYKKLCQQCHLYPREELKAKLREFAEKPKEAKDFPNFANFTDPDRASTKRFLKMQVLDLDVIGTDPNQALNFYRRIVVSKAFPLAKAAQDGPEPANIKEWVRDVTIPAGTGLYQITSLIRAQTYRDLGLFNKDAKAKLLEHDRYRSVPEKIAGEGTQEVADNLVLGNSVTIQQGTAMSDVIQAPLGYKARPLDGVWATAPYLHNGSVPTIDDLLLPVKNRPVVFYTGSTLYEPIRLGYVTTEFPGSSRFDTRLPGNRNTGHEFRDPDVAELEAAYKVTPQPTESDEERMARVVGLPTAEYIALSPRDRQQRIQRYAAEADPPLTVKGVIGPALDEGDRARLIAYLKTI